MNNKRNYSLFHKSVFSISFIPMARTKVDKSSFKNSEWIMIKESCLEPEAERRVIAIAEIVKMLVEVNLVGIEISK